MKRIVSVGAGLFGLCLLTAAPAGAQPTSTVNCSLPVQCNIVQQAIKDTIKNYTGIG
jgi:hypothetical protein